MPQCGYHKGLGLVQQSTSAVCQWLVTMYTPQLKSHLSALLWAHELK